MHSVSIRRALILGALLALPATARAQTPNLPQQIADAIAQLSGGIHTGFRMMHAKGVVVTGNFTPAPGAAAISKAAHFRTAVPVTVRFSDGTGVPVIPDNDPNAAPRGMAVRFNLAGGAFTDIVAISHNGFVVGSGEDFLAFLTAVAKTKPDSPHPTPIEAFLGAHPRAVKFLTDNRPLPVSFATLGYYGNNAFVFVDSAGTKRAFRYQILPAAGFANLDSAAAARTGPTYLFDELTRRLAKGPIKFKVVAQLANSGDQTSDGSLVWPADRKTVELGTIALTTVAPDNEALQRSLTFNPIFLTSGIELSDDQMVPLRSAVYAISISHRK